MAQMAEQAMGGGSTGDTFLTDMLIPGVAKKGAKKSGKATFASAQKPNLKNRSGSAAGRMTPTGRSKPDPDFDD